MSAESTETAEVIEFANHLPIEINYANAKNYYKASSYDEQAMTKGYVWHQIVVMRTGSTADIQKRDVLQTIFDAVGDEEFYPVAYRMSALKDMFLVRQCRAALDKLFKQNLCLTTAKHGTLFLRVQLNVAKYVVGQVDPFGSISEAVRQSMNAMDGYKGRRGVLNLSFYAGNKTFDNLHVELGNPAVFQRICTTIFRNDDKYRQIVGINLRENNISTLTPLSTFKDTHFVIIDLRDNRLRSVTKLVKELHDIKADDLFLCGNPATLSKSYQEALKPIMKNFKTIDGVPMDKLCKGYTTLKADIKSEKEGFLIDWSNKADIKNFEDSEYWHALIIPDPEHSYPKKQLMHYFFLMNSVTRSEVYPCYYEFNDGQHKFLVRRCYDQLEYLAGHCNLQIKVPMEVAPEDECLAMLDDNFSCLPFYLRMNISKFQAGQVEPVAVIQKEIAKGFSGVSGRMNLENFNSAKAFENVYVTLGSPRILSYVLMLISRKYPSISELALGGNGIFSMGNSSAIKMMTNVKRIDLRNNNIHDLSDINILKELELKSLVLEGNPICAQYQNASDYIMDIKSLLPTLVSLDNVQLDDKNLAFGVLNNYVCDVEVADFVELFVPTFFQQFDSEHRYSLAEMYHAEANFTVCFEYEAANERERSRLSDYRQLSRGSAVKNYHVGVDDIMAAYMTLPRTTHDLIQFTTDMPVFNKHMVVLVIGGVLEDIDPIGGEITLAFSRTFVFKPIKRNAGVLRKGTIYKISNEQWLITNPTPAQRKSAFMYRAAASAPKETLCRADQELLCAAFKKITQLKTMWCIRYLNEGAWDLAKALECYIESQKKNEVPTSAYV